MSATNLDYLEINLTVEYDFEEGEAADIDSPGCANEAYITAVFLGAGDVDIKDIMDKEDLRKLSERVADTHYSEGVENV